MDINKKIKTDHVNHSSLMLTLDQALSNLKKEKFLSDFSTKIGNPTKI
jgi:hypothetical protein